MSIVTGRGDSGETDLLFGKRIRKTALRVEAGGCVDELNSAIGVAVAAGAKDSGREIAQSVQKELIMLMGELATLPEDAEKYDQAKYGRVGEDHVKELAVKAKRFEDDWNVRFKGWAVPGKESTLSSAQFDLARTICRRAERAVQRLEETEGLDLTNSRLYLNRLSDLLWILARGENLKDSSQ